MKLEEVGLEGVEVNCILMSRKPFETDVEFGLVKRLLFVYVLLNDGVIDSRLEGRLGFQ